MQEWKIAIGKLHLKLKKEYRVKRQQICQMNNYHKWGKREENFALFTNGIICFPFWSMTVDNSNPNEKQ